MLQFLYHGISLYLGRKPLWNVALYVVVPYLFYGFVAARWTIVCNRILSASDRTLIVSKQ